MARTWPDIRPVYYGTAAERAAFPITGEAAGALFFDYDDEKLYKWDGAAWVEVGGAGGGAPANAEYLTLALDGTLTDERRFVANTPLVGTDSGANADYDLDLPISALAEEAAPAVDDWLLLEQNAGGTFNKVQAGGIAALGIADHDHSAAGGQGGQDLHDLNDLDFSSPVEIAITGGDTITRTQVYHIVAQANPLNVQESFDVIAGGADGDLIVVRPKAGDTIQVLTDSGNVHLSSGSNVVLNSTANRFDHLALIYDAESTYWNDIGGFWLGVHNHSDDIEGGSALAYIQQLGVGSSGGPAPATISAGGAITYSSVYMEVDTNAGAASDDLDTITVGPAIEGQLLILKAADGTHTVVVKHNTGNIWLLGGADITLDDVDDHIAFIYDGAMWCSIGDGIPIGVDPAGHTHSKLVASDGAPDALSADASGYVKFNTKVAKDLINGVCEGRLTLVSGTPVTTADQTAKTTVYFTPYKGNRIAVYDGTNWILKEFTEKSVAVPATTVTPFDIFIYDNAGTLTLETANWTNDTTRATALTTQDGVYVKSGATTRRYLGTGRTTGSSGQCEDSLLARFLWNYYNRVSRKQFFSNADSHVYGTATWRQWNASAAAKVEFILGLVEDVYRGDVFGTFTPGTDGNQGWVGLAFDVTNTAHIACFSANAQAGRYGGGAPFAGDSLAVGYHYMAGVEFATANVTFLGILLYGTLEG